MNVAEKNVVITGAAAGFGLAIAEALCAQGSRVIGLDINAEALGKAAKDSKLYYPIVCDVSDPKSVECAMEKITAHYDSIDILINNAGIMKSAPLVNVMKKGDQRKHSFALWRQVIEVNLSSVFYMTSFVADLMLIKRTHGVIINVSSIAAHGNIGQTAYSASKAGVEALTKVWAKELGPLGIRCAAIAPGFCNTKGAHEALEESMLEKWIAQTPLKRTGTVEEIVSSVLFIIQNDFLNGVVLSINGGLTI